MKKHTVSPQDASRFTRRRFLQTSTLAALAATFPFGRLRAAGEPSTADGRFKNLVTSGRKLRIACIGVGGRGGSHLAHCAAEEIVAFCDVDFDRARKSFALFPNVPRYRDYRQMFEEMGDRIDAVVISTPDHMHFPPALLAIQRGKHVYLEKPITHTIGEARILKAAAAKHGVVTQMGNQGHAKEGCRVIKEWIEAGVIGTVREVHSWTNRPIWPQGADAPAPDLSKKGAVPIPDTLDWNLWLGVAPERDYAPKIAPFNWRGLWDYGCGALGDMGCHIMDAPFWALNLRGPVRVSSESEDNTPFAAPKWSVVTYEFPARGALPPVKYIWYDGKKQPVIPKELAGVKLSGGGSIYIGDKGMLYDTDDYGGIPRIFPAERAQEFVRPPRTLPRVPKADNKLEWINACKGAGPAPCSNFVDHSCDLTETVLLGNLALHAGKPIQWNPATCSCEGMPELNRYINKNYRLF
ncbi:MAG: Gfo/Idh/MocA family oxidoreductase [Opitutaceae bacterium]|jgi:predicted dehydrogenase|nr:Gfo/Idh/MocA family oxidoreductase [Opitutaceae bacterium]